MNFWRSSAPKAREASHVAAAAAAALLAATMVGCGKRDGLQELADARAALEAGEYAKALESLEKSLKYRPSDSEVDMIAASANFALGNIDTARAAVEKVRAIEPRAADVVELAGNIAFHAKDFDAARKCYLALAENPEYDAKIRSRGYSGLGTIEWQLIESSKIEEDRRDRARVNLLLAIRLDSRNPAARLYLAHVYRDAFHYNETAIDQFNLYAKLGDANDPRVKSVTRSDIPALKELLDRIASQRPGAEKRNSAASAAALKQALAYEKRGDSKKARASFIEAYKADVSSYEAAVGLANVLAKDKASQEDALNYFMYAGKLRPSNKDVFMRAGEIATRLNKPSIAAEAYSRAVAASPSDVTAIDNLIRALRKANRGKTAAIYQKYRDELSSIGARR